MGLNLGASFRSKFLNSRGFTLVEVLVVSSVMAVLGLGIATMLSQQSKQMATNGMTFTRNELAVLLDMTIGSDLVLTKVLTDPAVSALSGGNAALAQCVSNTAQQRCENDKVYPIYLFSWPAPLNFDLSTAIAGPDSSPATFTKSGKTCVGLVTDQCAIQVTAWAQPSCLGGAATCKAAAKIRIGYKIERPPGLADFNRTPAMAPKDSFHDFDMSRINPATADSKCPNEGEVMIGVKPNGEPICMPPLYKHAQDCGNNQDLMYGITADGSPRCRAPVQNAGARKCPNNTFATEILPDGSLNCKAGKIQPTCRMAEMRMAIPDNWRFKVSCDQPGEMMGDLHLNWADNGNCNFWNNGQDRQDRQLVYGMTANSAEGFYKAGGCAWVTWKCCTFALVP